MDSNKVSVANDNVNSLFKSSTSVVETACDARNWSGEASKSFNTQMTDFIETYNNVITQQLELYQDAVVKYNDYVAKKQELASIRSQIAALKAEKKDTSGLEQRAAALEAEINQLRAAITGTLATIESVNIAEANATTNIKEGLAELIEVLASFNPEDISTHGKNGYIDNLLNIPYYMQTDARWANYRAMSGQRFGAYGCGYTSLAMILCGLKRDKNITPRTVNDYLKAQIDTNGDGYADAFVDLNNDGRADLYDALSRRSEGDGLLQSAILNSRFQQHYGVNVEQVHVRDLQHIMDQGRPCLIGTPGHYVMVTPGNKTYTDANGNVHRTTIVYDPYYPDNTKEYEGAPYYINHCGNFGTAYAFSNAK
ncbi:MAG: hypothetical protein MR031_06060 [Tenericutes bacterium]|nr:hypothetical protein [Mycoplasmatota bacterium]